MPELLAGRAGRQAGPRVGAGVLDGRGGVLARHAPAGARARTPSGTSPSRSSPPTSTRRPSSAPAPRSTRRASPRTSRRSGWRASSPRRATATACASRSATSCVFAVQDLIKDPPFSHLDLLSAAATCSSTWSGDLQQRLIAALPLRARRRRLPVPGLVGDASGLASRRSPSSTRSGRSTGAGRCAARAAGRRPGRGRLADAGWPACAPGSPARRRSSARALAERVLLERHTPAGVVVNAEGNVLYFHGRTGRYLRAGRRRDQRAARRHGSRRAQARARRRPAQGRSPRTARALREAPRQDQRRLRPRRPDRRAHRRARTSPRASSSSCSRSCRSTPRPASSPRARRASTSSGSPTSSGSSPPRRSTCAPRSRSSRPPTRSSSPPTRSCSRATRSCSPPTRSSRPPRRSCSRSTRS